MTTYLSPSHNLSALQRTVFMLVSGLVIALLQVLLQSTVSFAAPTTFTVTNTSDTGAGSLRQAIDDANSNGNPSDQDVIEFSIPGFGDQIIQPQSTLSITQSVLIDGYTQGDAEENSAAYPQPLEGTVRVGINALNGNIEVQSHNVTIKGISITGSATYQIIVTNSDNFVLSGSYIGVTQNGFDHFWGNGNDGYYGGGVSLTSSDDARIGGIATGDRNVIGRCGNSCVGIHGSAGNATDNVLIAGNNIGIAVDSVSPITANGLSNPAPGDGNGIQIDRYTSHIKIGDGISGVGNYLSYNTGGPLYAKDTNFLSVASNLIINNWSGYGAPIYGGGIVLEGVTTATIGGNDSLAGNTIAGNESGSFTMRNSPDTNTPSSNISILHNYFGVMNDHTTPFPNLIDAGAITVEDDSHDILIQQNVIHNTERTRWSSWGSHGIQLYDNTQHVSILQNSIYNNAGIGIDHVGTMNNHDTADANDSDTGPNELLNSPGYTNITENAGNTDVTFTLDVPAGEYRIEFFSNTVADPSGIGEGETYLGYVNITHSGNGLQQFNHTLTGTGHTNLALTATKIDPSTPSGFGPTSEFGGAGTALQCPSGYTGTYPNCVAPPVADLAMKSVLINPQDFAIGNILNYQMTITNYGPDGVDISTLNDSNPAHENYLFSGVLHSQLTYVGSTGDVSCIYYGDGSAVLFGPAMANHSDHGIYYCGYNGTSPRILAQGESISFTISTQVIDDSDPQFNSYAIAFPAFNDPDLADLGQGYSSGSDIIDYFTQNDFVNNFSWASSTPLDTEITKTLDNPENMVVGETVNYSLTMTNNGPSAINPQQFNVSGPNPLATALFTDLLPPNLTYISSSNPDVACNYIGPASMVGTALSSVSTHNIILCGYFGPISSLTNGQSISTTLSATVNSVPNEFTNYAIGSIDQNDPDWQVIFSTLYANGDLVEDVGAKNVNNLSSATYTTSYDHDGDGVADQIEDATAPGGDGNGDGTADKLQSDVTSTSNPVTGKHTTLAVAGDCHTVTDMAVVPEAALPHLDTSYDYPLGLNDFSLDCNTPGGSATVTVYYDKVYDTSRWNIRKFIDNSYTTLSSASVSQATVNGTPVTTISYSLRDGSSTDDDNATNSVIDDPTGPAITASASSTISSSLVNTGTYALGWIIVGILLIGTSLIVGKRRHTHER